MAGRSAEDASGLVVGPDGLARPHWASSDELLRHYYDTEWGMPVRDERGLFERLAWRSSSAGCHRRRSCASARVFGPPLRGSTRARVAGFGPEEVHRLLGDPASCETGPR